MKTQPFFFRLFLAGVMLTFCTHPVLAQNRSALVIGNRDYQWLGKLKNPVNDAADMADKLRALGFKVIHKQNTTRKQMRDAMRQFSRTLKKQGGVGLFYYAGHGIQVKGENYLIPVKADISEEYDVRDQSLSANYVLNAMESADNELNIILLDACRDNPYARSRGLMGRGLARMEAPTGSIISYATGPGKTADDGDLRNGTYTHYLLKYIDQPGLSIEQVFKRVRTNVEKDTGGKQIPWEESSLRGDFYFTINAQEVKTVTIQAPVSGSKQAEITFWNSIKDSQNAANFIAYLDRYGEKGIYSKLAEIRLDELKTSKAKPIQTKSRLTVRTTPDGARIRILNIVPKYQDGIELKPGSYHIEVTKRGYGRYLKSIELGSEDVVHVVVLNEKPATHPVKPQMTDSSLQDLLESGSIVTEPITGMKLVSIKPGCFQMGSPTSESGRDSNEDLHRVCITQGFYLGKYEVTQSQWRTVMGDNPSHFKNCGGNCPVEKVSWTDIQTFINKLNSRSGKKYRLPTEAEWEYACRGGRNHTYCGGENLETVAWYGNNSGGKTHSVAQKQANSWGLYDMSGNVWEWVQDWYGSGYYSSSPTNDPKGPSGGSYRMYRGGGWGSIASGSRSANRYSFSPGDRYVILGFRLARTN